MNNVVILYYVLSAVAIGIMAVNLVKAYRLKKALVGGEVGEKWNYSLYLIGFFFVGYVISPFFLEISPEFKNIVISLVFLFGAIFVFIMIDLIFSVITLLGVTKRE